MVKDEHLVKCEACGNPRAVIKDEWETKIVDCPKCGTIGTYIPADTRRPSGLGRSEKTGVIEFTGSLADLEQAVGLRIEREGQAFRIVPLERRT